MGEANAVQHWILRKNCSFTPRQVLWFYASLTAVGLSIALGFAWFGMWLVLPFTVAENLMLVVALLYYARHALDRECVWLQDGQLRIDVIRADQVTHYQFAASWARLEWRGRRGDVLWLCHGRQAIRLGSYITPRLRRRFATELRVAVRRQQAAPPAPGLAGG